MPDAKPRFANFPERDLKVVLGSNINQASTKALTRLTIGTYEMSVAQQEKGAVTAEAARQALNALCKAGGMALSKKSDREYTAVLSAENAERRYSLWVTTPFELGQSAHLLWVKYQELGGEARIGIAFKLCTAFSVDDVLGVLKNAEKNAVVLPEGEAYTLKGNPPPRFQKKAAVDAPAAEPAPAP